MLTRRHRAPVIRSINLLADGVTVHAQFDQEVRSESPAGGWTFGIGEGGAVEATVSDAIVEGRNATFTLSQPFGDGSHPIYADQIVLASYASSTGSLTAGGVANEVEDITEMSVGNLSAQEMPAAPSLVSATVDATGLSLALVFDDIVDGTAALGFSLSNGETISSGTIAGNTVTLVTSQINTDDVRTVSYSAGAGDLAGIGGEVEDFTGVPVTNNSEVPA